MLLKNTSSYFADFSVASKALPFKSHHGQGTRDYFGSVSAKGFQDYVYNLMQNRPSESTFLMKNKGDRHDDKRYSLTFDFDQKAATKQL